MKKKPANTLSVDELLNSLNNTEEQKEEVLEYHNDVLPFLTHFNIVSGAYPVSKNILYKLYKTWSKEPVSKRMFSDTGNQILFSKTICNRPYFLLNLSSIEISKKSFTLIEDHKWALDKSPLYRKHFENFINKYSLNKEEIYIQSFVLYYLYDKWCYSIKRKKPLGYNSFIMFCSLFFKNKRITDSRLKWYLVSKEVYNHVTKEEIEEIEKAWKEKKIRKGQSKQKKSN